MLVEDKSKHFSFFFALRILSASLRRHNLIITFFGPALLDLSNGKPQYDQDELQYQFFLISLELSRPDHYQ